MNDPSNCTTPPQALAAVERFAIELNHERHYLIKALAKDVRQSQWVNERGRVDRLVHWWDTQGIVTTLFEAALAEVQQAGLSQTLSPLLTRAREVHHALIDNVRESAAAHDLSLFDSEHEHRNVIAVLWDHVSAAREPTDLGERLIQLKRKAASYQAMVNDLVARNRLAAKQGARVTFNDNEILLDYSNRLWDEGERIRLDYPSLHPLPFRGTAPVEFHFDVLRKWCDEALAAERPKPPVTAAATTPTTGRSRIKAPTEPQQQLANLYESTSLTQAQVAAEASKRLRLPITQEAVSRAVQTVNRWRGAHPEYDLALIPTRKRKVLIVDPQRLALGRRTDPRRPHTNDPDD